MFLSKLFFNRYFKDIKPSYLLIEVFLIFIGITTANYFQEIKINNNNKKFIKENLLLFENELNKNIKVNNHYIKAHLKLNVKFDNLANQLFNTMDTNQFIENNKSLVFLIDNLSICDFNQGVENIVKKDINLLKNNDMINIIESSLLDFDQVRSTLKGFNSEIEKLKSIIFINFEIDFNENKILSVKDLEVLKKNYQFKNQMLFVNYLRKMYVNDLTSFNQTLEITKQKVKRYLEEEN